MHEDKNNNMECVIEEGKEKIDKSKLSLLKRISNVFVNPVKAMEDIAAQPKVLVPILIIMGIFALTFVAKIDLYKEFTVEQIEMRMLESGRTFEVTDKMLKSMMLAGIGGALIGPLLGIFIKSLVTHGIAQIFNGKGKFKATFSVIAFAYFIQIFGEVIRTVIALLTKSYMVTTSPALFLSDSAVGTPLFTTLSYFDVFGIWYLIVSIVGVSIVHKLSKGKAAAAVLIPWIIIIGVSLVTIMMKA